MDLNLLLQMVVAFVQANIYPCAALAVLFGLLLYRSPKLALGVFGVTMLLAGVFLLISDVATSGANYKTKGISRSAHGER
jgi:hypothetical protein